MTPRRERWRPYARLVAVLVLLLAAAGGVAADASSPAAAAQQTNSTVENQSPYYANHTDSVPNDSWFDGDANATAPAIVTMLSRVGTFVIGPGGNGPMLFGMVLLGGALSFVVGAPVGLIGGAVLAVAALFGVVAVGLAPQWFTAVAMFGVGLLLASAARRVMR